MTESWNPKGELQTLRWREDQLVTNAFGERVWLKPCYDVQGCRIGITDCCAVDTPCDRHQKGIRVRGPEVKDKADHFTTCGYCRALYDRRELSEVLYHLRDGHDAPQGDA